MTVYDEYPEYKEWAEKSKDLAKEALKMKNDSITFYSYLVTSHVIEDVNRVCKMIRNSLLKKFDVFSVDSPYYKYSGLCDEAARCFIYLFDKMCEEYKETFGLLEKPLIMHGEVKHKKGIPSKIWGYEHTILLIPLKNSDQNLFVDITRDQIDNLFGDTSTPSKYVFMDMPDYFLPDIYNPKFNNRFLFNLNYHFIKIRYKGHKVGIYDFFEYIIKGKIYDMMR